MAGATGLASAAPIAAGNRQWRPFVAVASARRTSCTVAAAASSADQASSNSLQRRQLLSLPLLLAPAAAVLAELPAAAEEEAAPAAAAAPPPAASYTYTDAEDKFTIEVPAGWVQGGGAIGSEGTLTTNQARFSNAAGLRKVVAFLPEGKPDVSVAITVQFLGADFTGLGSFGTAQDFAAGVVSKMDNSYLLKIPEWRRAKEGPVQVVKLLDAKDINKQRYIFSYTVAKQGEPQRTVYQAVAVGNNGRYSRFFTVNASCTEADVAEYGPVLQRIVNSFQPPAAAA